MQGPLGGCKVVQKTEMESPKRWDGTLDEAASAACGLIQLRTGSIYSRYMYLPTTVDPYDVQPRSIVSSTYASQGGTGAGCIVGHDHG